MIVMKTKVVAMVGALDTKGEEYEFIKSCIESFGVSTIMLDIGTFEPTHLVPDYSSDKLAIAGGTNMEEIRKRNDRDFAMDTMCKGVAVTVKKLYDEGKIDGVISMGGGGGTTVGTSAMKVPKKTRNWRLSPAKPRQWPNRRWHRSPRSRTRPSSSRDCNRCRP